jgi:hypothetical protein
MIRVTVRQARAAERAGLSAPDPGRYEPIRLRGSRTVRYRNVETSEIVSRRQIENARHAASYEKRAIEHAKPGVESPTKQYYRAVRRLRAHNPHLTLEQARRRVTRRRVEGFRHFADSYMERHDVSRAKAEFEVRRALATLNQPRDAQSDRARTRALRAIGRIGEDEFYSNGTLSTTGFEGR